MKPRYWISKEVVADPEYARMYRRHRSALRAPLLRPGQLLECCAQAYLVQLTGTMLQAIAPASAARRLPAGSLVRASAWKDQVDVNAPEPERQCH